jgi:hypothetical protein
MNSTITNKPIIANPQGSLSPRLLSSGHSLKQTANKIINRPKALSQFLKKEKAPMENLSLGAKVIKIKQIQ